MKIRHLKFLEQRDDVKHFSAIIYSGGLLVEVSIVAGNDWCDVVFPAEVETASGADEVRLIDVIKKELVDLKANRGGER